MNQQELDECFEFIRNLTIECGEIVKLGSENIGKIETKTDFYDIVTKYDGQVEETLMKAISEKYPNHCFIGEEMSSSAKQVNELTNVPTWIIDPIDGTSNFIKKLELSCISIALVVEKEIVMGIVYNPFANEMYTAQKGKGAYLNGNRMNVSNVTEINKSLLAHEMSLGSLASIRNKVMERARKYVTQAIGIRCFGSAALTLCYVARGIIDGFNIDDLWPWDIAAGALIVQEAGGVVINTNGGAYDIMKPNVIATGTPELCATLLQIAREVDEIVKNMESNE